MPILIEELHTRLLEEGLPVPESLTLFRQRIWADTRAGLVPAPVRGPRTDGKKGLVGWYPDEVYEIVRGIVEARSERGRVFEQVGQLPKEGPTRVQKRFGISFWVPEAEAQYIEVKVKAGIALSQLVFYGMKWLHQVGNDVREAILAPYTESYGIDPKEYEGRASRWGYLCAIRLASIGFESAEALLDELRKVHGSYIPVDVEDFLDLSISFKVVGGQVVAEIDPDEAYGKVLCRTSETERP